MSQIASPAADAPVIDVEALKKAEQFIEAEEGASNKLRGALGIFASATAVVMSLFHLYTAYAIVPAQVLRPVHVAFVLFLGYLLFPASKRYRHRIMWWDWAAAFAAVAVIAYILQGGDDIWDRNTSPDNWDIVFGIALILRILGAPQLRSRPAGGAFVYDARRHLRGRRGRLFLAHHPVHDLWGVPAILRGGQVLHRFLVLRHGRKVHQRRPYRGARFVPPRRAVGERRGDHGDARLGRLPDARQGGLREKRGRRAARRGRLGRDHLAAGARRGGLPHRRVPEDLVSRRALDGDDPDLALLLRALPHGRDRRAQVRHEHGEVRAGRIAVEFDEKLLVPLPVAGVDRRIHAHGIFARAVGVLGDDVLLCNELFASRLRIVLLRPVPRTRTPGKGNLRVEILQGARGGLDRGAQRRHHLRRRRHHRRRGDAHGSGPQIQLDHHRIRRRLAAADGDLHFAHRLDRGTRRPGDRVLHHLRGDRGAGDDQAGGARLCCAHVHFLLRGALRSLAANRALALRCRGDHRRRSVQDDAAILEIHHARLPRALHVRARSLGRGTAPHGFDQNTRQRRLGFDRARNDHRRAGDRRARGRRTRLAVQEHELDRTGDVDRRRAGARVPDHYG